MSPTRPTKPPPRWLLAGLLATAALPACLLPEPDTLELTVKTDAHPANPDAGGDTPQAAVDADLGPNVVGSNCEDFAVVYCWKTNVCQPIVIDLYFGSEALCQQQVKRLCEVTLSPSKVPDSGWTPAAFMSCVSSVRTKTCRQWLSFGGFTALTGCRVAGLRATGAPCAVPTQCQTAYCKVAEGADCGVCAVPGLIGAPCKTLEDCASELVCSATGTCRVAGTEGDDCDENRPCDSSVVCANAKCTQPRRLGESCDPLALPCDFPGTGGVCAMSHICEPYRFPGLNDACAEQKCGGGLQCRKGFCRAPIRDGDACSEVEQGCTDPSRCEMGVCKFPLLPECPAKPDAGATKG